MAPTRFALVAKRRDTSDTWTLELEREAGDGAAVRPGPVHDAVAWRRRRGADLDQRRPRGRGATRPHGARSGLATEAICAAEPGDVLGVRGPFGGAWPVDEAAGADVIVVCGGIGLAPLRPAILALLARRERYGRLLLLYGGRSPAQLLYPERARRLGCPRARGRDHRRRRRPGVARSRRRGAAPGAPRRVRRRRRSRAAVRARGDDALRRSGTGRARGGRASASTPRWSATCSAGSACAGIASSDPTLVCRDGPVYRWDELEPWLAIREL